MDEMKSSLYGEARKQMRSKVQRYSIGQNDRA